MAERRMFAKTIIDSDAFLDMPMSARLLYYDLAMRADDDGFLNNPKKTMRITGASEDDIKLLAVKKFIIPFDSGVIVIKHWKIHNYIRKDTYTETKYKEEKASLYLDENKAYTLSRRAVDEPSTQVRLGKDSIDKVSIDSKNESKKEEEMNNTNNQSCVRESYEDIMKDFEVEPIVKKVLFEFIKHLKLQNVVMINSRLESIIVGLDMRYREESDKVACVKRAINGGHKKLEFE